MQLKGGEELENSVHENFTHHLWLRQLRHMRDAWLSV